MWTKELNGHWLVCRSARTADTAEVSDLTPPDGGWMDAVVPGDIHNDLLQNGKIAEPFYSDNLFGCRDVTEKDWIYKKTFTLTAEELLPHSELQFDGIDTYADLFLNGRYLGSTENMFRQYTFDVTDCLRAGENELYVYLKSVKRKMRQYPSEGYFGCFNVPRIFMRKAQCHFSWDWAPDFPATGIWESVRLTGYRHTKLASLAVRTLCTGEISFFAEWDYPTFSRAADVKKELLLTVFDPDGGKAAEKHVDVTACRENFTVTVEHPQLWWPQDLGDPVLYRYVLEYYEDGSLADRRGGECGIREITYRERPRAAEGGFTCELLVNGVPVFLKGANWVPLDILTGCIPQEKYARALRLAKKAGYNCLRVWGGGIYEKEVFYALCDRLGILVWQDLMFACGEVPDDAAGFADRVIPEVEYQIKRLRNHACLALWTGGNERVDGIDRQNRRGDRLINYTLNGMVAYLDRARPYFSSSPWGYGVSSNGQDSGDAHCNSFQAAMDAHALPRFRDMLMHFTAPMVSEIAVQGCSSVRFLKTFLKDSELWPPNDVWDLHMTCNPYDGTGKTFCQQQREAAETLFGPSDALAPYVQKSMAVHSEFVKAEIEFHRTRKGNCSAAMLWMFSDIWPCGTWAVVEHNLLPKAAYYSQKRANRPVLPAIVQTTEGIRAFIVNDTRRSFDARLTVGQMTVDGRELFCRVTDPVAVPAAEAVCEAALDGLIQNDRQSFLYITLAFDGKEETNVFFPQYWRDIDWPEPGLQLQLTAQRETASGFVTVFTLHTQNYARMVSLEFDGMENCLFSDNYFDLLPGQTREICVESPFSLSPETVTLSHWLTNGT